MEAIEEGTVWRVPERSSMISARPNKKLYECSSIPVFGTNITSIISWYTTAVNDDSKDHKSYASGNFHYAENEFNLDR